MKVMWCWRCQMEVPMLDEEEFVTIEALCAEGMKSAKAFRARHNLSLDEHSINDHFRPMQEAYEQMTGMPEINHNAILHHRISIYGKPCEQCGKPLRTPTATFCPACGTVCTFNNSRSESFPS